MTSMLPSRVCHACNAFVTVLLFGEYFDTHSCSKLLFVHVLVQSCFPIQGVMVISLDYSLLS